MKRRCLLAVGNKTAGERKRERVKEKETIQPTILFNNQRFGFGFGFCHLGSKEQGTVV